jgi:hypothetical protein
MTLTLAEARNTLNFKLKSWQTENEAFQENDLDQALAEAVEAYSRSRPVRQIVNLSVTAGQAAYSFPSGALQVQPCFFTDEETAVYTGTITEILNGCIYFDPESPAGWYRTLINRRHASQFWLQQVQVDDYQQKIILSPMPSTNTTGKIIVDYAHALNGGGSGYDTIPEKDKRFILNYAESVLLKLLARAYSLNSNDVGDRKNRGLGLAAYLEEQADKLQSEFRARFRMPIVERT